MYLDALGGFQFYLEIATGNHEKITTTISLIDDNYFNFNLISIQFDTSR